MEILKPKALRLGDTIGIFTPSIPSYCENPEMFENSVKNLHQLGFQVELGFLTQARSQQGYRSGSPQDRAQEFMALIENPLVHGLMATIGGANSSSMIPYLDFAKIRQCRKVICGYSDITSLHLAILHFAKLQTFYGPSLMTCFGEYPHGMAASYQSFLAATTGNQQGTPRNLNPFPKWSNHRRDWKNGDWKNLPRQWETNRGWQVLSPGSACAEIIVANLSTLMSAAGTPYFPDLKGKILLIESMRALWSVEERNLRQLQLMGVFDKIVGLIIGKPEAPDCENAPFSHHDLLVEIVGERNYPIVTEFDCSHTTPMHTIGENSRVLLDASNHGPVIFQILEEAVEC